MSVDTTFLPKTTGLVFGDRLVARSDKGRVFGLGVSTPPPPPPPPTTIGDLTITPSEFTTTVQKTKGFVASFNGDATDVTYAWSIRSGTATYLTGQGTSEAAYLFTQTGTVQIQCTVTSPTASDSPVSFVALTLVS